MQLNILLPEEEINEIITCKICQEFIGNKIFQCPTGHIFCIGCTRKMLSCPFCRISLPRTHSISGLRNRALENILSKIDNIPCMNEGCDFKGNIHKLYEHTNSCLYKICKCPLYDCNWSGLLKDSVEHMHKHTEKSVDITDKYLAINLTNTKGLVINALGELLLKYNENLYVLSFTLLKNIEGLCITLQSFTTEDIKTQIVVEGKNKTISNTLNVSYITDETPYKNDNNVKIPYNTTLVMGKNGPKYSHNDQLEKEPLPESLDLDFLIFLEPDKVIEESKTITIDLEDIDTDF